MFCLDNSLKSKDNLFIIMYDKGTLHIYKMFPKPELYDMYSNITSSILIPSFQIREKLLPHSLKKPGKNGKNFRKSNRGIPLDGQTMQCMLCVYKTPYSRLIS